MAITSGFIETEWPNYDGKYIVFTGSSAQSYTLGDAKATPGISVVLKLRGTGAVTVGTVNSQTIDGASTLVLGSNYSHAVLFSDGSNWAIQANGTSAQPAVSLAAQTASVASTALFTAPSSGLYSVVVDLITTTAGSAGTVTASVVSNNGLANVTQTTSTCSLATLGTEVSQTFTFYAPAGQVVNYLTTVASAAGSPAYALRTNVKFLG